VNKAVTVVAAELQFTRDEASFSQILRMGGS
jgi:hypothetical protein